ncbi:hypothetical protein AX16_006483 [Volvariella volvacea WC 439]|nr:hypothetical protein AX16_006483 [Volvariella volvacea WC 439]
MSVPVKLQQLSTELQKLQNDLSAAVAARQKLDAQLSENELVKEEFGHLTPENTIYKLIGPVLVKQDQDDAKQNVQTRLEFIRSEMFVLVAIANTRPIDLGARKRVEGQLKDIQTKSDAKKQEIANIQASLQQEAEKATSS